VFIYFNLLLVIIFTSHLCEQAARVTLCPNKFDLCLTYMTARTFPCKLQRQFCTTRAIAKVLLQSCVSHEAWVIGWTYRYVSGTNHLMVQAWLYLMLLVSRCVRLRAVWLVYHESLMLLSAYDYETQRTLTGVSRKVYDSMHSVMCMLVLVVVSTVAQNYLPIYSARLA
jgi:hypothetical protein